MICNDLVMPVLLRWKWLGLTERRDLSALLLGIRRGAIVGGELAKRWDWKVGDRIVLTDIDVRKRSVRGEAIEAPVKEIEDDSMFEGESEVQTEGVDGTVAFAVPNSILRTPPPACGSIEMVCCSTDFGASANSIADRAK